MKHLLFLFILSNSVLAGNVNLKESQFKWTGEKLTSAHWGNISLKEGNINFTNNNLIKDAELVVDMNSITVTDLKGEMAKKLEGHLKADDFFGVKSHPEAKLKINKDSGSFLFGDLTIKGSTHPITIAYTKIGNTYKGKMKFNRTDYGIKYGSGSFFDNLGDKIIKDHVLLDFTLKVL